MRLCEAWLRRRRPVRRRDPAPRGALPWPGRGRGGHAAALPDAPQPDRYARPRGPRPAPSSTCRTSGTTPTTDLTLGETARQSQLAGGPDAARRRADRVHHGRADSRSGPFSDAQIALLKTFADQAVIAIENVRLFTELEARNRDLTETLEQQTATSEILRVICRSTDRRPAGLRHDRRSASRLCEAELCVVFRFDGQLLHFVAHHSFDRRRDRGHASRVSHGARTRASAAARAVLERRAVEHIPDVHADPDYTYGAWHGSRTFRSIVAVPMLRADEPLGDRSRSTVHDVRGPSPTGRSTLLETFADQAVIAIENVAAVHRSCRRARPRSDPLGRRAPGARRGQPGRQLHARPRDRAGDHRQPGRPALRQRWRDRLRVRRGHPELPRAGHAPASRRSTWRRCGRRRSGSARGRSVGPE